MAKDVILPALGMSQDTGKIVQWLKVEGEHVTKGEPLAEIETDKATVEIEAPADGVLARVSASAGDDVPVGQVIALILSAGEVLPGVEALREEQKVSPSSSVAPVNNPNPISASALTNSQPLPETATRPMTAASMLASRIAADHNIDLSLVKPVGKRIQKADVLTYLQSQQSPATSPRLVMASPKARRLAAEGGKDLVGIRGSGPGGAVLAADVLGHTGAINRAHGNAHIHAAHRNVHVDSALSHHKNNVYRSTRKNCSGGPTYPSAPECIMERGQNNAPTRNPCGFSGGD